MGNRTVSSANLARATVLALALAALVWLLLAQALPARARASASIVVTTLNDEWVTNGQCSLREAVLTAMDHGNLELNSALRETDCAEYHRLGEERRQQEPYRSRRVHVSARETPGESVYVVRDEGPGFDPSALPDPLDPANMENAKAVGIQSRWA